MLRYWYLLAPIASAILPDICDVDELQTGQRREGLFTSVMAFMAKLEISLAIILAGYIVSWSDVDVKINQRWESVASNTISNVATIFPIGESAVFGFKNDAVVKFDRVNVKADNLKEVELSVSNESPTQGFRSLGVFSCQGTSSEMKFSPTTAKYLKIELRSRTDDNRPLTISVIAAGTGNILDSGAGGKLLAAQPPMSIQMHLFWIAMIMYIVFAAFTLFMAILFPLTEEKMKEIRTQLDERHLALSLAGKSMDEVADKYVREHLQESIEFVKEHPETENEMKHNDREK